MEDKTKELVNKAKNGDQTAFAELYEAYYKYTFLATKNILSSYEEREDVTQEAFTKVFQKLQAGEVINNFGGLLNITAKNIAKDHIKAREAAKRPQEVYLSEPEDGDDSEQAIEDLSHSEIQKEMDQLNEFYKSPEEAFEEKEVSEILKDILGELPSYQQEALTMFYMEQMTYPEIAELYGESVNTIKSRVNQGKKKVEAKILDYEKKNKIKLHSVAPLVFFFYLFHQKATAEAAAMPAGKFASTGAKTATKTVAKSVTKSSVEDVTEKASEGFLSKTIFIAGNEIGMKAVVATLVGVVALGSAIGVSLHNNTKQADEFFVSSSNNIEEDIADESTEVDDNYESEIVDEVETEETVEEPEQEIITVEAPTFAEVTDGIYYKYWDEHRAELEAQGLEEGDGSSVLVRWNEVPDADGYEVKVEWTSAFVDLSDYTTVVDVSKTDGGYLVNAQDKRIAKDAYSAFQAFQWANQFSTSELQFVDTGEGSDYSLGQVKVKAYRLVDGEKIWSEETIYN